MEFDALTISLIALCLLRFVGAIVFLDFYFRQRDVANLVLVFAWLVYAAAPAFGLYAVMRYGSHEHFMFGALAAWGLGLLVGGALLLFQSVQLQHVLWGILGLTILLVGGELAWPGGGSIIGLFAQVITLLLMLFVVVFRRTEYVRRGGSSYTWLIVTVIVGLVHTLGFMLIYPRLSSDITVVSALGFTGTLALNLVGLVFFVVFEQNIIQSLLRQSEARYRSLFESAPVALMELDITGFDSMVREAAKTNDGVGASEWKPDMIYPEEYLRRITVLDINQAAVELFGAEDKAMLLDHFSSVVTDSILRSVHEVAAALLNRQTKLAFDAAILRLDGDARDVFIGIILPPQQRQPTRMLLSLLDITPLKKVETELRQRVAEREQLLQELYHRTRNNMQVINAMLLLQSGLTDDMRLQNIMQDTVSRIRAMALVQEKLYNSRNLSQIRLDELVPELCALLKDTYRNADEGIRFEYDLQEVVVSLDTATPVGLVMSELISNALKHAYPAGQQGVIRVKLQQQKDEFLQLTVADDGVGVPPDFDFFRQQTMGIQSVIAIIEHQLQGEIIFNTDKGVACTIRFRDGLYRPRI